MTTKAKPGPARRPLPRKKRAASSPRLSDSTLPKLAPGDHTDPAVKGLQVRIRTDRHGRQQRAWLLRYKWEGKPVRLTLGGHALGLADARELALASRALLEAGIDPRRAERPTLRRTAKAPPRAALAPPAAPVEGANGPAAAGRTLAALLTDPRHAEALKSRHSVEFLASEYLRRHVQKQRKRPEYVERFLVAEVLPKWAGRDARTISPREVLELLDGIVDRGSPTMANRGAGLLSQMFRYGLHRRIVEASPVQLLYRPGGKEKPRERALSDLELAAVLRHLDAAARYRTEDASRSRRLVHVLRLLLLTGQRRGELAAARWENVSTEGEAPTWRIPAEDSKTGKPHAVPLSPAAVAEFKALREYAGRSDFVLPTQDGKAPADPKIITRAVARNLPRLQALAAQDDPPVTLEAFTAHDLRRTCRTGLARLKVAHDVAERVLNHALPEMRRVYDVHEPLEEMRAALVKWAEHLASLVAESERAHA